MIEMVTVNSRTGRLTENSTLSGDRPLAVLSYYATHPQSYYYTGMCSADFVGMGRDLAQAHEKTDLHIHFNGAGGNVTAGKYNDGSHENRPVLAGLIVLVPALLGLNAYLKTKVPIQPPFFARTIHPAPPASIEVHGNTIDLVRGHNPLRALEQSNPEQFKVHLANGRATYYKNCVYCHGDNLRATGMFAHGLDPIPTNFVESSPLPQLTESFIFWRIAKGGPGLPEEGGPWDSAMPAWEKFLTEQEMWEVVLFLYDFTGNRPRALEQGHE